MKKILTIAIMITLVICALSGCGGLDEQSTQCLSDIQKGLQNRWDYTNLDYETYDEYKDNVSKGISAELSAVDQYKDTQFSDKEFATIISKYITALENQAEGIAYLFTDTDKYNTLYIENGLEVRCECLNQLKSKYNLNVDETYKSNFENVLDGSYTPLIAPGKQVKFDTEYGEIGIAFIGFESLVNPADDKELVLYCEIENFSYYDEWNGESLIFDYFMGVYDGAGYNIEVKGECYDYIDGYKECAGVADLRQGEKGKFAIMLDYTEDIDVIYVSVGGTEKAYGCYLTASKSNDNTNDNNENTNIGNDPEVVDPINYSLVREQMSNFSCEGMYNIYDGWVYSLNFPEGGGSGLLSKMRTDGTDYTVLTTKGTPYYIYIDGEYIYSIIGSGMTTKIYRCRLGGTDLTQLVEDDAWYLQVAEDYLYYNKYDVSTGTTLGFYRSNKDGSGEELVMDKEIYYSYVVGTTLYYQDDNDNETIHKYDIVTKSDEKITSNKSYGFVVDGEFAYYIKNDNSTADGDMTGLLIKINLKTKEEVILYDGVSTHGIVVGTDSIYFINTNDEHRIYSIGKDGSGVKLISQDTNCTNLAIFGNKLMYLDYDNNREYVDAIYLCSEDGSNKVTISKIE